jgi:hypothetical protein
MVFSSAVSAQCPTGYSSAQLNWDVMDFLRTGGSYAGYVTATQAATQTYAFATQKVTIAHTFTGTNSMGVVKDHTGETGSLATGADVQFLGNGSITVTFQTAVQNVTFSLYDIDVSQRVEVTAATAVALSRPTTTSLTLTNNNTTTARADGGSGAAALTSESGTLNVSITGPITTFTINVTNTGTVTNGPASGREDGSIYLSDINACTNVSAFPTNYYATAKPWDNQPGYVIVSVDASIYQVDPATGKAKLIFTDPAGENINSLAYDPSTYAIYYTYSLTASPSANKKVMKYNYNTSTLSTWISDVTALGVTVYESGVESGAAAFYNGSLYLGVEGYASGGTSSVGRKSIVWRIDINSSGVATGAVQAYGVAADNGTSGNTHDWSDIGINNGVLYDFDGAATDPDVYQYNMYTGAVTRYTPTGSWIPRQTCIDWTGAVYNMDGTIATYNGSNNIVSTSQKTITSTTSTLPAAGSWGDGAEAFKPKGDLGDAPASYDPVANAPAVHEVNPLLRLGATISSEWTKNTSLFATADNDDGLPTPSIVINNSNYLTSVNVFNNTGATVNLCAWVDFNNNGVFDASEGIATSVPTSSSMQTVQLFWPNPTTTLTPYSYTFIRIRVASASTLTVNTPTGWFDDGEVEDYRVQVNAYVLPSSLVRFDARRQDVRKGLLSWQVADEVPGTQYLLQHSQDGRRWNDMRQQYGAGAARSDYSFVDAQPFEGLNYYRLQVQRPGAAPVWSSIRQLLFNGDDLFVMAPNPARHQVSVQVRDEAGPATFLLYTASGALVYQQTLKIAPGGSTHSIPLPESLPAATYIVELRTSSGSHKRMLAVQR